METTSSRSDNKKDLGWKYNSLKAPAKPNCNFCNKTTPRRINRAKQYQKGSLGNATACLKVPREGKEELWNYYNEKKSQKSSGSTGSFQMFNYSEDFQIGDDDLDGVELVEFNTNGKRPLTAKSGAGMQGKGKKTKGPMDLYLMKPENIVQRRKESKVRQTSIMDADPEARARTVQYIARFFYQAGIPFNAARLDSFKHMVETIGRYGPSLKPPSYHELRVPLLKKELQLTNDMLEDHKKRWAKYGCSIMSHAWTGRKQRSIINFLVNSPSGTVFVESVDASSYTKTGDKLYELLDGFVERIGEKNVIQVITDSDSNYVLAGQLLQAKRTHLFWTPCAARCVDLILEDIEKLPNVKRTLERAIFLVGFIYNHAFVLSLMRTFTKKKELVRYGVTRFAITYLTLERVHKQKINLKKMFTSDEWMKSKFYKEAKGKRATDVVLMPSFWNEVVYALKVMGPLVGVLRLAGNEKRPAMGYIYEAMDRAKEAIQKAFDGNEDKYKHVFSIIDNRWEIQLRHPLHAAGHFLNPQFFYSDPSIATNKEIVTGFYDCIKRLIPNQDDQDKILDELHLYKEARGTFADPMAIRSRSKKAPAQWWSLHGLEAPKLMNLAIRILSLTCTAAGCERNWSVFEQIHSKKRNRLEHKKMQDLVFVKYNQALKARYGSKDETDPISLDYIDDGNEWLIGKMGGGGQDDAENELVFGDDDDLTWGEVARASGAEEPRKYTRRNSGRQSAAKSSKGKAIVEEVEEEEANTEESEEEIEGYHSSDRDDSSDDDGMDAADEDDIDAADLV